MCFLKQVLGLNPLSYSPDSWDNGNNISNEPSFYSCLKDLCNRTNAIALSIFTTAALISTYIVTADPFVGAGACILAVITLILLFPEEDQTNLNRTAYRTNNAYNILFTTPPRRVYNNTPQIQIRPPEERIKVGDKKTNLQSNLITTSYVTQPTRTNNTQNIPTGSDPVHFTGSRYNTVSNQNSLSSSFIRQNTDNARRISETRDERIEVGNHGVNSMIHNNPEPYYNHIESKDNEVNIAPSIVPIFNQIESNTNEERVTVGDHSSNFVTDRDRDGEERVPIKKRNKD